VIIVRHGRTAYNREGLFRGLLDVPLDDVGIAQAESTGSFLVTALGLRPETTRAIYASRLSRTMATAMPLALRLGVEPVPHPGLLDVDVGRWEGRAVVDVLATEGDLYAGWVNYPASFAYPDGESLAAVHGRVSRLLAEIAAGPGGDYVLFTHRVPAKLLVAAALGIGPAAFWRIQIDNASVSQLARDAAGGGFIVTLVNATQHLAAEPVTT
jgi:broad specificity phosphatase PhoE